MQEIRIEGYVGADPVTKNTNGRDYTYFSVGCSSKTGRKDNNGNDIYATTWYTVYCTPTEASGIFKGTRVLVTGMPKYSYYADRNGITQIQITISFAKIYISTFVSAKSMKTKEQPPQGASTSKAVTNEPSQPTATIDNMEPVESDDLPF